MPPGYAIARAEHLPVWARRMVKEEERGEEEEEEEEEEEGSAFVNGAVDPLRAYLGTRGASSR